MRVLMRNPSRRMICYGNGYYGLIFAELAVVIPIECRVVARFAVTDRSRSRGAGFWAIFVKSRSTVVSLL